MHSIHLLYSTPVVGGLRRAPQPTYKQGCLHLNFAFTMRNSRSAFCFIPQVTTEPTVPLPMQQWSLNNAPLESVRLLREYVRKFLKFSVSSVFRQTLSVKTPARGRGGEGDREREGGREAPHFQVRDPNKKGGLVRLSKRVLSPRTRSVLGPVG